MTSCLALIRPKQDSGANSLTPCLSLRTVPTVQTPTNATAKLPQISHSGDMDEGVTVPSSKLVQVLI